jgi:hypothetical protein
MLSVEKCQQILNQNGKKFTLEEVKKIRDLCYQLSEREYEIYKQRRKKGRDLYKSVHR